MVNRRNFGCEQFWINYDPLSGFPLQCAIIVPKIVCTEVLFECSADFTQTFTVELTHDCVDKGSL